MVGRLRNMTSLYLIDNAGILCLYRQGSKVANNLYIGSAGGHFEHQELNDPKACILREMEEELRLKESDIEGLTLRYITVRLRNGEIRQNYYFFGRLKEKRMLQSTEGMLKWFSYDQIPQLPMPMSAKHMICHYIEKGRFDCNLYAGITRPDGTDFVALQDFADEK